jgi:ADP-ribose pyrophosphatase YjhB (NUDIX family)
LKTSAHSTHVCLAVVLQVREGELQALLWQRARDPDAGAWALPGGYLDGNETLEGSIRRHLAAKVDVRELSHLEQLGTWSEPHRHPRERQLATAYLGLVPTDTDPAVPEDTTWHPVGTPPRMAFDHGEIVLAGRERLRAKLSYTNLGFALAPPSLATRSRRRTSNVCSSAARCSRKRASGGSRDLPAAVRRPCTASVRASSR